MHFYCRLFLFIMAANYFKDVWRFDSKLLLTKHFEGVLYIDLIVFLRCQKTVLYVIIVQGQYQVNLILKISRIFYI